jgi:ribosomal protein L19E
MGNAIPPNFANHPKCGAHCRSTGQPCRQQAMKNGRCKMHGGKAGRKPTHGRYTQAAIEQRRDFRELLRALRELI